MPYTYTRKGKHLSFISAFHPLLEQQQKTDILFPGQDLKRHTNTDKDTYVCPAHDLLSRLYGQLLITKPLDSFCLYLVLSPSWLWVSTGLQKGLFPYLECHSFHPWRDKGRRRLSVFISQRTGHSVWVLWLLCCWLWGWDGDQGLALFKFRFEKAPCIFFSSTSQGQCGRYVTMRQLQ